MTSQQAVVPAEQEDAPENTPPESWAGEPTTLQAMTDEYIIENKLTGRTPGTSLYIVQARKRSGEITETCEGQTLKLFLVT